MLFGPLRILILANDPEVDVITPVLSLKAPAGVAFILPVRPLKVGLNLVLSLFTVGFK